jgi:hypothetical protein
MVNEESIERAAYLAANQIDAADLGYPKYAFPGTRRSKRLDAIARIIKEVMVKEMGMQLEAAGVNIDHEVVPFYEVPIGAGFSLSGVPFRKVHEDATGSNAYLVSESGISFTREDGSHVGVTKIKPNTQVRLLK